MKKYIAMLMFVLGIIVEVRGQKVWTSGGPYGGWVTALTIDSVNTGTVYAGTYTGGLFKSVNGGEAWFPISFGLPKIPDMERMSGQDYLRVSAIVVNPESPEVIYVGTRGWPWKEIHGRGVYKSDDGGITWQEANQGLPARSEIWTMVIDPSQPEVIYVGTGDSLGTVYKSTDAGERWIAAGYGLPDSAFDDHVRVWTLAMDPNNSSTLYAGVDGIFRTVNGGESWTRLVSSSDLGVPYALLVDPTDTNRLFSIIITNRGEYLVARSFNRGEEWEIIPAPGGNGAINFTTLLKLDSYTDPILLYVMNWGSDFLYSSRDMGQTYDLRSEILVGLKHIDFIGDLELDPLERGLAFFGNAAGVWLSDDNAVSWRHRSYGLTNTFILDLAVNPRDNRKVFAGTNWGGAYRSNDGGRTWTILTDSYLSGNIPSIAIDPVTPDTMYMIVHNKIRKSMDGGNSWYDISDGANCPLLHVVIVDPNNHHSLYTGGKGGCLFKSLDGGQNWERVTHPGLAPIVTIALAPGDTNIIFFGGEGGMLGSYDGGDSWDILLFEKVIYVLFHPSNSSIVFASTNKGIWKSIDKGASWVKSSSGLPVKPVHDIKIHEQNPNVLLAGTQMGVFSSQDTGKTWTMFDTTGMANIDIRTLAVIAEDSVQILAGSFGSGVFVYPSAVISATRESEKIEPNIFVVRQGYPNPFNASINLSWYMKRNGFLELTVYNIRGETVKKLASGSYMVGTHMVIWDGTDYYGRDVSSGIYFANFRFDNELFRTLKLVLLR